ncbi:hypothetical protein LWI28_024632 [Acer negundo]|uniref:Lipoxygenase n=1 Tax=Acer negundo TaxID=4023 RepID=A0AAD5J6N1_ACENE|nr:hypothetical protein LWI28_024632 [Acer negundo]
MLGNIVDNITGENNGNKEKVQGTVVLMKKNVLDFNDFPTSLLDDVHELVGQRVSLQLVSAVMEILEVITNGLRGEVGEPAYLEDWITRSTPLTAGESAFDVNFDWDEEENGVSGAFIITNNHHSEFYLKTLTLEDFPGQGRIHFVCNSWVYPSKHYKNDRVFFTNQASEKYARPVLGGFAEYHYPRKGRPGRPPAESDPNIEGQMPPLMSLTVYVPRDEQFGHLKMSDFLAYALKVVVQFFKPALEAFDSTPNEFDSFEDVLKLFERGFVLPGSSLLDDIRKNIPFEMLKEILRSDGERLFEFPMPQVIKEDKYAWKTDEEFAREMLARVNPVIIRRLEEFPPTSKLDCELYGNQNSTISAKHIESNSDGLTIDETILFLKDDGTLKPPVIELSSPHPDGDQFGAVSKVYSSSEHGVEGSIWQLAKAYVGVNDSAIHHLISHWLHTHAVIELFVIATDRQLSVLHPIHKLLLPHFRDTMFINAFARQTLINAGGLLATTIFPAKYAMELSSVVYKNWIFSEQALPEDLKRR